MSYFSIFFLSFTIALTGALVPGPLLTLVVAKSLRYGGKTGPLVMAGHAVLEILMVSILILGIRKIIGNPIIINIISIIGALILFYFGIELITSLSKISLNISTESHIPSGTLLVQGITMSIANPYWTIWWLTVGLGLLLTANKSGIKGLICFFTGHILADFTWYSIVSYSIGKSKKIISQKTYRRILSICGFILILFGLYFGISVFLL